MGQVLVTGSLIGGPPAGSESFPAAQFNTALKLSQSPKGFQSASGILTRTLTDAATFVTLAAVGAGRDVPRADFLYIKAESAYTLRITQDDGVGGTTVSVLKCFGLFLAEFPTSLAAVTIEVAGNTRIEYFVSGIV